MILSNVFFRRFLISHPAPDKLVMMKVRGQSKEPKVHILYAAILQQFFFNQSGNSLDSDKMASLEAS